MSQPSPGKGLLLFAWTLLGFSTFISTPGWSADPLLPEATVPDLSSYLAQSTVDTFIKTIGFCMDHRPYEAASSLGSSYDFGLETSFVSPPNNLSSAIGGIGSSASSSSSTGPVIPFIPSIKIHLRRGLGEKLEIGSSALYAPTIIPYVGGTLFLGGDLKYVLYKNEDGFAAAVRASYNYINLGLQYTGYSINIKTVTITPQLVVSRNFRFIEPYFGVGYQYTYGTILATIPSPPVELLPGVAIGPVSLSADGAGTGINIFAGVSLVSSFWFRFTIETAYNPGGENAIGTKIGVRL